MTSLVLRTSEGEPAVHDCPDDVLVGLMGTLRAASVTLDVEHAGYPIGHPAYALRTIQLGTDGFAVVLDAGDPFHRALAAAVLDAASEIVGHAAQADVIPVALACGRDSGPWWDKTTDTNVLAALADPHLTGTDRGHALDLKGLSGRLLPNPVSPEADKARSAYFRSHKWLTNVDPTTAPERSGWAQADYAEPVMARYAASDVLDTAALRRALPEVGPELLGRERAVQRVTARIAEHGLRLDRDWINDHRTQSKTDRDALRADLAGMGVDEPGSTAKLGIAARIPGRGAAEDCDREAEHRGGRARGPGRLGARWLDPGPYRAALARARQDPRHLPGALRAALRARGRAGQAHGPDPRRRGHRAHVAWSGPTCSRSRRWAASGGAWSRTRARCSSRRTSPAWRCGWRPPCRGTRTWRP